MKNKNSTLILLILALANFTTTKTHAQGNGAGGGETCRKEIERHRKNIQEWIENDGASDIDFSVAHDKRWTYNEPAPKLSYKQSMLAVLAPGKVVITCYSDAKALTEIVKKLSKTKSALEKTKIHVGAGCINYEDEANVSHVDCDVNSILGEKNRKGTSDDNFQLIHHEFASIAGVEHRMGVMLSDFSISNQLGEFQHDETIRVLGKKNSNSFGSTKSSALFFTQTNYTTLREAPYRESKIIGRFKYHSPLIVIERQGQWAKVYYYPEKTEYLTAQEGWVQNISLIKIDLNFTQESSCTKSFATEKNRVINRTELEDEGPHWTSAQREYRENVEHLFLSLNDQASQHTGNQDELRVSLFNTISKTNKLFNGQTKTPKIDFNQTGEIRVSVVRLLDFSNSELFQESVSDRQYQTEIYTLRPLLPKTSTVSFKTSKHMVNDIMCTIEPETPSMAKTKPGIENYATIMALKSLSSDCKKELLKSE